MPIFVAAALNTRELLDIGQKQFIQGEIAASTNTFNEVATSRPDLVPVLWQRGISLYFNKDFKDCNSQFQGDVTLNPSDTEEIIWATLCSAEITGDLEEAQKDMITLRKPDRRPIMRYVYDLFKVSPNSNELKLVLSNLLKEGEKDPDGGAYFYSRLYASLYYIAAGNEKAALLYIKDGLDSRYANRFQKKDYMVAVALNTQKLLQKH